MPTTDMAENNQRGNAAQTTVQVATTVTPLLGQSETRRALIITSPPTNRVTLGFGTNAVLDAGITLYPGQLPLILTRYDHGALCTGAITAISATAVQAVSFAEEHGV